MYPVIPKNILPIGEDLCFICKIKVTGPTINEHLKNIFADGELAQDSVIRKFRITATDGKKYNTQLYNLDAIISAGHRVNSIRATRFRQWATHVLREFTIKGFVSDKKRLENGTFLGMLPNATEAWINAGEKDAKDQEIGIVGNDIPLNRHFYVYQLTLQNRHHPLNSPEGVSNKWCS